MLGFAKRFMAVIGHKWWYSVFVLVLFMGVALIVFRINGAMNIWSVGDSVAYSKYIDPILSIFTFVLAAIIGLQNLDRAWTDSLDKRLSVCFYYKYDKNEFIELELKDIKKKAQELSQGLKELNDKARKQVLGEIARYHQEIGRREMKLESGIYYPLIFCFDAVLGHESDIRSWAQQLGAQVDGGRFLKFSAQQVYGKKEKTPLVIEGKSKFVLHYSFGYCLNSIPNVVLKEKMTLIDDNNFNNTEQIKRRKIVTKEIKLAIIKSRDSLRRFVDENES